MAKDDIPVESAPAPAVVFDMMLEEFCSEASTRQTGVEMLGGFYADARRQGQLRATRELFQSALDAFATRAA